MFKKGVFKISPQIISSFKENDFLSKFDWDYDINRKEISVWCMNNDEASTVST